MNACCVALLMLGCLPCAALAQSGAPDKDQVIAAVQKLFDAMAAHDAELAKQILLPEGRLVAVVEANGTTTVRSRSNQEFADGLSGGQQKFLERIWNPEVRMRGAMATLWANYDFHLDGKFTHCGIDSFDMVKTADGWKIAGGIYTVERTGCPASPLGEPK